LIQFAGTPPTPVSRPGFWIRFCACAKDAEDANRMLAISKAKDVRPRRIFVTMEIVTDVAATW
jgi:hypothetical protein